MHGQNYIKLSFIKIRQEYRILYMKTNVFYDHISMNVFQILMFRSL